MSGTNAYDVDDRSASGLAGGVSAAMPGHAGSRARTSDMRSTESATDSTKLDAENGSKWNYGYEYDEDENSYEDRDGEEDGEEDEDEDDGDDEENDS